MKAMKIKGIAQLATIFALIACNFNHGVTYCEWHNFSRNVNIVSLVILPRTLMCQVAKI